MRSILKLSLGGALLLLVTSMSMGVDALGYATLGFSLPLTQRDIRINNNFDDAIANNNLSTHPNWPGYVGAELAMWKAAYEWGSSPFGDGSGDPTQLLIGEGGANFNPLWNGSASGSGSGWRNNIVHAPNVSGGGAIAWTYPSADGWLIEFADNSFEFADGPDDIAYPEMDIQAVGAHEYGHALGLDHSTNPTATMYPTIAAGSTIERNIATDDRNGIQSIYGVKDAAMPYIDSILGSTAPGATAIILGGNFDANDSRLWFNSDLLNDKDSGGEPFKISNLAATGGGTQIAFTVPSSGLEDGAVHVKISGGKHTLGEGHPFELGAMPPTDTLQLQGPAIGYAGQNVSVRVSNARPSVYYGIQYSFSTNGHAIGGHLFDLGLPYWTDRNGLTNAAGEGIVTRRLPGASLGKTFYLEAITLDNGVYEDSNVIRMDVH